MICSGIEETDNRSEFENSCGRAERHLDGLQG
jgi:hypothetical protein